MSRNAIIPLVALIALSLLGCDGASDEPVSKTYGPEPIFPAPVRRWIPTVHIAPAKGWPPGATPIAAPGFKVAALVTGLDHPRWLHVLPNGDVLVAETNTPPHPSQHWSLRGWVMSWLVGRAGADTPSANRITLLRLKGKGGVERSTFLRGLTSPFGMALVGDRFYVADTDELLAFPYRTGETEITAPPTKIVDLPAGPINHHWTKDLIASRDGHKLFVTVGSNSNRAENGIDAESDRAAILEVDPAAHTSRVFASGLRNPNGLTWQPQTGALWVAVNERDEMGNNIVPDYMTSVRDGGFYGWPYSYFGAHIDPRVTPQRPDLVSKAIVPDYALGAHTASLGLTFYEGSAFPPAFKGGAFVGQHGSWNRNPFSGYKVIFVPFKDGHPSGPPTDILTGFLNSDGEAQGRPVGVAVDTTGALLVADDVGNTIWRVSPTGP